MKRQRIRLMISLATLLTLCLTWSAGSVWAEGEEYLYVPVEVKDVGGKLSEEASFLITFERKDNNDTVSPLPDKTETILKPGETDEFIFERAAFTEPGDYLYTMKQEKATGDDNVITEDVTYTITVRVVNGDDGDSGLNATLDVRQDGQDGKLESAVFRNNDKRAVAEQQKQDANADSPKDDDANGGSSKKDDAKFSSPTTGEAISYWAFGLMGFAVLLGMWGIGRHVRTSSAGKDGYEQ